MKANKTILIVDDEPETRKGYQEFLSPSQRKKDRKSSRLKQATAPTPEPSDYTLLLASSGEEALEIFIRERDAGREIAAGFFDVKLGTGMDGLTTIQKIKAIDPRIHCVVVTAYHDRSVDEIHQMFGDNFQDQWDYLNKPFTRGEIIQKARQMLGAWNDKRRIEVMNNQLVASERLAAVGQVARGIGHEFGNILLRIMGKADLASHKAEAAPIKEHLEVILKACDRASVIVRNLQSFSKSEPKLQVSSINDPIEEALSLVNHELIKHSVEAKKDLAETPSVVIDKGAFAQVLLNLFINATYAMPKGGVITVSTENLKRDHESGVAVHVADTGTGITKEVMAKIFEFAFTTKGDQGSGLGLAISREIIEAHGGTLTARSEEGKGTRFSIWIPLENRKRTL